MPKRGGDSRRKPLGASSLGTIRLRQIRSSRLYKHLGQVRARIKRYPDKPTDLYERLSHAPALSVLQDVF